MRTFMLPPMAWANMPTTTRTTDGSPRLNNGTFLLASDDVTS
jgi:hypothetical protein